MLALNLNLGGGERTTGFWKLVKKSSEELSVGGHSVDVLSVIRDGKVLLTSRTARTFPKDHVEPRIIEIMFGTHSGSPIFAYYLCPAYQDRKSTRLNSSH